MAKPLTLLVVHAHPDDEAISTGGVLARYGAEGLHTVLVTCTRGEEGEIVLPELNTEQNKQRLAEIRDEELGKAVEILGIKRFYQLAYRDSGMVGSAANAHPDCFHMADLEQATGRLVEIIRRERPEVLVSYNEEGGYGHPDHIKAHLITVAAFDAAGDPARFPQAGTPWTPLKLYYTAFRRRVFLKAWEIMRERGKKTPLDNPDFNVERYRDDQRITSVVPTTQFTSQKLEALRCHRTQISPDWSFFIIPEELKDELVGNETFILIASRLAPLQPGTIEDDLFAGLR